MAHERYQREIEEILDKVNEDQPAKGASARPRAPRDVRTTPPKAPRRAPRVRFQFSPGRLLMTGVALLFLALLFLTIVPILAAPAAWAGIGLFIVAYVLFFIKPRRTAEKRWRGQSIEDEPDPSPLVRFWRWVTRG